MYRLLLSAVLVPPLTFPSRLGAEVPRVLRLEAQRAGPATYFRLTVQRPADCDLPGPGWLLQPDRPLPEALRHRLARLPRLVPQDDHTAAVYLDWRPRQAGAELQFVGKVQGGGPASLVLYYPVELDRPVEESGQSLAPWLDRMGWGYVPVTLDWDKANWLRAPAGRRNVPRFAAADDLEGRWAHAQSVQLEAWSAQASDPGFFTVAASLTRQKYHVRSDDWFRFGPSPATRENLARALYETTTGAAALTASLATDRVVSGQPEDPARRVVPLGEVTGIDVGEHPWERMMAGRKPAAEPLAGLVPRDNWYVAFRSIRKALELGDWLDEWGGNVLAGYELASRDYRVVPRYKKQLCLKDTGLARTLGPALVREVALTGSDLYLREGSDVSVIFRVTSRDLFLAAVAPYVQEARKEFGPRLRQTKEDYRGVTVESFVTPLREVSLHRAAVGDCVIYSNSLTAIKRILDTHAGREQALADSLDFRYMRTVFCRDEPQEDGFAFFSDAFIRRLVGPASKIKEKRRLEALGALALAGNAALFAGWETGKLPADHAAMLKASGLAAEALAVPEGKPVVWDGRERVAVSESYNTLAFATPLVELPIDAVTAAEKEGYEQFRDEYRSLWRQYFDPVGFRFSLRERRLRVETYILPVVARDTYMFLREVTGDGTTTLDASALSPRTLVQVTAHLSPAIRKAFLDDVGDMAVVQYDDGQEYRAIAEAWVRSQWDTDQLSAVLDAVLVKAPLTIGLWGMREAQLDTIRHRLLWSLEARPTAPRRGRYRGVQVTRVPTRFPFDTSDAFHDAIIGDTYYVSTSLDSLRDRIDREAARKQGRLRTGEQAEINASLYLAPEAAFHAADVLQAFLEYESYRRAVGNGPVWYALHRGGAVSDIGSEASARAALRLLGYVPVSPDGEPYAYDRRNDDMANRRHGSLRRPQLHDRLDEETPLARLVGRVRWVRADLRFREDGIHTVLTIEQAPR
jgi:hypothetical protein